MKKLTRLAKTDKALDGAFGLFTPHQPGAKRDPVNIEIKANGMITSFPLVKLKLSKNFLLA